MNSSVSDYRVVLKDELERRCTKNPRYSLRAFAKDLGVGPSRLSEILSGKAGISKSRALAFAKRLGLSAGEASRFADLVESTHARSPIKRELARVRLEKFIVPEYQQLQLDTFKTISDWYHHAILELFRIEGAKSNNAWVARALGITEMEAKLAIERLLRLGMLNEKNGTYEVADDFAASPDGIPTESIKKFHQQILTKAEAALFSQSVDERNISTVVMAFDADQVAQAHEHIRSFRRNFSKTVNPTEKKNSVYCLSVQFFQLTKEKLK